MNDQGDRGDEVELEPLGEERPLEPWEPWSSADLSLQLFGTEPRVPLALFSADSIYDIIGHGSAETGREVGGILLGSFVQTSRGAATRVQDMDIADSNEASLTHITFTHAAWEGIHAGLDQRDDDLAIVGWYHTHPGFGPFLSAHDRFIQENFFPHPLQIALVLDPVQRSFSVFGSAEGSLVRCSGCWAYADQAQPEELQRLTAEYQYVADQLPTEQGMLAKWLKRLRPGVNFGR